jgi:hypothetical protein
VRQTPYLFAPADDRNTLATPTVGCFNVRSAQFIPEQSETYICHDLPRIKTFCSNN